MTAAWVARGSASRVVPQMAKLSEVSARGPIVMTDADGLRVRDADGREYLDALSGLFNVNVGYGRAELADVAASTMRRLSFATGFFGRTTPETLALADKLAAITPDGIERFLFTAGGSDAVDTAIKLVRHANVIAGRPEKMTIIARRDSYHGMTLGSTTATGQQPLRERIGPLLPGVVHVAQADPHDGRVSADELEQAILREGPQRVAAFIGEPISLPAGVAIPADDYWPSIREVCTRHEVLLIADEVVTGFGRTGRMFGSEHWSLRPDLITMSKGLSSGYQPIGALGLGDALFEQLSTSDTLLPHGFTSGGHPVACAVALANIEIIEREGLVENVAGLGAYLVDELHALAARRRSVRAIRSLGFMSAVDVDGSALVERPELAAQGGARLSATLLERGVLLRPYGNTIAFGLALTATREDVDELLSGIDDSLADLERTVGGA